MDVYFTGGYGAILIYWGIVWIVGGTALIYGLVRAIAAEDTATTAAVPQAEARPPVEAAKRRAA